MLFMVGLGLASELDLTLRGVEALKKCEEVYFEAYTGKAVDLSIRKLEGLINKKVVLLGRDVVESNFLTERAKKRIVGFIVQGDALCATTHAEILLNCEKRKIKVEIIHNASIISAVSETGLQIYKFGKITSVPFWQDNFKPISFLKVIEDNLKIGAHSLVLLDLDVQSNKFMSVKDALDKLCLSKKINQGTRVLVVSRLGSKKQKIVHGKISDLKKTKVEGPSVIIIPGKLHFKEEEFLMRL